MKKEYHAPEMDITCFEVEDVCTVSIIPREFGPEYYKGWIDI